MERGGGCLEWSFEEENGPSWSMPNSAWIAPPSVKGREFQIAELGVRATRTWMATPCDMERACMWGMLTSFHFGVTGSRSASRSAYFGFLRHCSPRHQSVDRCLACLERHVGSVIRAGDEGRVLGVIYLDHNGLRVVEMVWENPDGDPFHV